MQYLYIPGDPERFQNYHRAVARCGGVCVEEEQQAEALLLPGGGDVEPWRYGAENTASLAEPGRDDEELRLLDAFLSAGKPVLGVCRGLQLINVYFGGTLLQDIPGHSQIESRDRRHATRTAPSILRSLYGETVEVNSAHHQAADRLGSGRAAVPWAEDGIVEAVVHRRYPILALQWHPERLGGAGERLFRAFLDGVKAVKIF